MRILYISNGSNFLGAGGMEYHLQDITAWLEEKGVETGLAIRKGTFIHRNLLDHRRHVYPLSWTGFGKMSSFLDLVKTISHFSPDIISINRERDIVRVISTVKLMGLFSKKRPKVVAVFHNSGWKKSPFILSLLDGTIFPNRYLKNIYDPGDKAMHSAVIYHGIRLPEIDPKEKLNRRREKKYFKGMDFPIIGMVGELRKNQTELIEVAWHLKQKNVDFIIALVGRGSDQEIASLKEKINQKGLSKNFIFTGGVDRKYMPEIYYDLDISVTTNRSEPFGIAFIESLASYTPLVAYNSGGAVEVIEKGGGILVNGGPAEMAAQLAGLISNDELRRSSGIAGRNAAEKHFSIDAMGEQHYKYYLNILK